MKKVKREEIKDLDFIEILKKEIEELKKLDQASKDMFISRFLNDEYFENSSVQFNQVGKPVIELVFNTE